MKKVFSKAYMATIIIIALMGAIISFLKRPLQINIVISAEDLKRGISGL
jgi:hypothetical protein